MMSLFPQQHYQCQSGELWRLGQHLLLVGDATKERTEMPEHLTYFSTFTRHTESLSQTLQELYQLECQETPLAPEQKTALIHLRLDAHAQIRLFRELLESIEQAHGLTPEQTIGY